MPKNTQENSIGDTSYRRSYQLYTCVTKCHTLDWKYTSKNVYTQGW